MKQILKRIVVAIISFEARLVLRRHKPKIVAVTGCVGKTSTKDAIATILSDSFDVRKSQKSFNSEIGVPLVVLGCENAWSNPFLWLRNIVKGILVIFEREYPKWLVLEMGVERPKDIANLISWIKPHISVITALTDIPSHVEFFSGPEAVVKEKSKILKKLSGDDYAILNNDDYGVHSLKEKVTKAKVITYGFEEGADIIASNYHLSKGGINFKIDFERSIVPVRLQGVFGKHNVYPALAAIAVGKAAGLNLIKMSESLSSYVSPPGRLRLLEGVKGSFILDDTYNSSPIAVRAALDTMKDLDATRKIVVLGDMLELGKYTVEAHKSLAEDIIQTGVQFVFTVGLRAKFIAEGLREKGFDKNNIFEFSSADEVKKSVEEIIEEGDMVLVKGSQSMRMEKIVEEIMAEPERKGELLVRQSKAWLYKL
ncbi:MAG: UDP-N-acetylmuramoyl-tripeptide--D-alanyl-D-alanine ligase [Patescibacteria group bacterium]